MPPVHQNGLTTLPCDRLGTIGPRGDRHRDGVHRKRLLDHRAPRGLLRRRASRGREPSARCRRLPCLKTHGSARRASAARDSLLADLVALHPARKHFDGRGSRPHIDTSPQSPGRKKTRLNDAQKGKEIHLKSAEQQGNQFLYRRKDW